MPLLRTKLRAPSPRDGAVLRGRLTDRLARGTRSKLTLVSAPPGFGKSTLVSGWIAASQPETAAWLSLDADDNVPATFWSYVIAALQTVAPGVGERALAAMETHPELALRTLLNDLLALGTDIALVLDDYHVIERPEVHDGVTFMLDHVPANAHLVIVTRADPPLPLSRLRARGELVEIRAEDLRFTADEAAEYLDTTMGLELTAGDVAALDARTEGWIAALQLAALSMQGRDDPGRFIASFSGDDRYLVDYLVDEVLARQSDEVRRFLLSTAVLDRLTAPLCDALTGRDDSGAVLDALDRANLFLVALDDHRRWFRYHHLFADLLRTRLLDEQPDLIPQLHQRASEWFVSTGDRPAAIRHALSAGDLPRAADLMELALPDMRRSRQESSWRRWADALPADLLEFRPVLSVACAGVLLSAGELGRVEELLQAAERWLATPAGERSAAGMVVLDAEAFERLPSAIALYRTAQARTRGDIPATMAAAQRALELAGEDDLVGRGSAAAFLGLAHWATGDLAAAYAWYTEGMDGLERAGHLADVVAGAVTQADLRVGQGRLTEASTVLERGLALATGGGTVLRGAPDMHVGIADLLRERNDLAGALRHLDAARDAGVERAYRQYPYRSTVVLARIRHAEGDLAGAIRLFDEAETAYIGEFSPDVRPIAALRARTWIALGDLAPVWTWARTRALAAGDPLSYGREYEHATLARLLVAQGRQDASRERIRQAIGLAERLFELAEDAERNGSLLDALIVLALAQHAGRDARGASASVGRAVALAEREGYVRTFLDEGPPMAALLRAAAKEPAAPAYLRRLAAGAVEGGEPVTGTQRLIEPLSERELEVLRLLGTELGGPAIARELVVSLSTVRTHTQNIYAKLGVNSRRAAVRRAQDLDLLHGTRR